MLLNNPPPGVYRFKVHQYSAAGSLRYLNPLHLSLFLNHKHLPLTHAPGIPGQLFRFTARRRSRSSSAPPPTVPWKVLAPRRAVFCNPISQLFLGQYWNIFSFTVAADGRITLGGQAQLANCQPPRLQQGNLRLSNCRSNGCRVEVGTCSALLTVSHRNNLFHRCSTATSGALFVTMASQVSHQPLSLTNFPVLLPKSQ